VTLYRVFPFDPKARPGAPGHPAFVPLSRRGRLDNPERYRVLYCSSDAAGAVAEAFGYDPEWTASTLRHPSGSAYALARFESEAYRIVDLDDAATLLAQSLRPSDVVTRERRITQAWALRLFDAGDADGVAWWSYYKPEWSSVGLWNHASLRVAGVEPLTLRHDAVVKAASEIVRVIRRA
jgi:hypothetical protein